MTLKTKRTVPIFATVLLVLATIGFGFLWVFFAMLGTFQPGYLKDNDLVMIIYYSPWYIAGKALKLKLAVARRPVGACRGWRHYQCCLNAPESTHYRSQYPARRGGGRKAMGGD